MFLRLLFFLLIVFPCVSTVSKQAVSIVQQPVSNQNGLIKEILFSGNSSSLSLLRILKNSILSCRSENKTLTIYLNYAVSFSEINSFIEGDTVDGSSEIIKRINKSVIAEKRKKNFSGSFSRDDLKNIIEENVKDYFNENSFMKDSIAINTCEVEIQIKDDKSFWVQDYFYPLSIGDNDSLLIQYYDKTNHLKYINGIDLVREKMGSLLIKDTIQGGNVLIQDANIAFVGKDYEKFDLDTLKKILKVNEIVFLGNDTSIYQGENQIAFHLDLFMSLAGTYFDSISKTKKQLILFSKFDKKQEGKFKIWNDEIDATILNLKKDLNELKLDSFYTIDTIPINIKDKKILLSHSNSITEINDGKTIMYMPHYYGFSDSSNIANCLKKKYGIKVKFIKDENDGGFEVISEYYGSMRCLTKVLSRY